MKPIKFLCMIIMLLVLGESTLLPSTPSCSNRGAMKCHEKRWRRQHVPRTYIKCHDHSATKGFFGGFFTGTIIGGIIACGSGTGAAIGAIAGSFLGTVIGASVE